MEELLKVFDTNLLLSVHFESNKGKYQIGFDKVMKTFCPTVMAVTSNVKPPLKATMHLAY